MRDNKKIVLEAVKRFVFLNNPETSRGLTTHHIATSLSMQRSNVSSILNELVEDGYLIKDSGRPVYYRLANAEIGSETSTFRDLIGHDESLKNAVQLAKALVLYPEGNLNALIVGEAGSGISYFRSLLVLFGRENNKMESFDKIDCRNYADNFDLFEKELFGASTQDEGMLSVIGNGYLFISNADILPVRIRTILLDIIELGHYEDPVRKMQVSVNARFILSFETHSNKIILDTFSQKIPVRIDIPSLNERPLKERFDLINHFLSLESLQMKRTLKINSELLICLLLFECEGNVKQLRNEIHIGCANAYLREYGSDSEIIHVFVSDFKNHVRKGFLNYKIKREEISVLLPKDYSYVYDGLSVNRNMVVNREIEQNDVYDYINVKANELKHSGLSTNEISLVLSAEVQDLIAKYTHNLPKETINTENLSKLVDQKVIDEVKHFLNEAEVKFSRHYSSSILFGLCLHINGVLTRKERTTMLSNQQILDIIDKHKLEYSYCSVFASHLENQFGITLPIDEVVFITMFILQDEAKFEQQSHPILVVAMHGSKTAHSIVDVVNTLNQTQNAVPFDLELDEDVNEAYTRLKEIILRSHQGKGIILMYDMGSIKTMGTMIMEETGIQIQLVNMPVTLMALDISRKSMMHDDIYGIYSESIISTQKIMQLENVENKHQRKQKIIVTLCTTGYGGALQLKNYLTSQGVDNEYKIVNLSQSNLDTLSKVISDLRRSGTIHALIGTFDPGIDAIPFIPISTIFEANKGQLMKMLASTNYKSVDSVDIDAIFSYLEEQLKFVNIKSIKKLLPDTISRLDELMPNGLSQDQSIGLLVHVASSINRIMGHEAMPINVKKEWIIKEYRETFDEVLSVMKSLESSLKIIFPDDEIANIVMIMKKI